MSQISVTDRIYTVIGAMGVSLILSAMVAGGLYAVETLNARSRVQTTDEAAISDRIDLEAVATDEQERVTLQPGRTYQISRPIRLYAEPQWKGREKRNVYQEVLAAESYFRFESTLEYLGEQWHEVFVNRGGRNYRMFVDDEMLRYQQVEEYVPEMLRALRESMAERAQQRRRVAAAQLAAEQEAQRKEIDSSVIQLALAILLGAGAVSFVAAILIRRMQDTWDSHAPSNPTRKFAGE